MPSKRSKATESLKSFLTFASYFFHYCYVLRGLLGIQAALVVLGGVVFSRCESIPMAQGIYFSLITATTVGYGDIARKTGFGQCVSVFLALAGTILFGLVIAVATQAFSVTIKEYSNSQQKGSP